jgi:hypothetical protein
MEEAAGKVKQHFAGTSVLVNWRRRFPHVRTSFDPSVSASGSAEAFG